MAGAVVEGPGGILLVRNQRPGGASDWSTPGGVIDAEDLTLLEGLAREVQEETGLVVRRWGGLLYEVVAVAHDLGWVMRCEVHHATEFEGELRVDDPDGIVVEASFVPPGRVGAVLDGCWRWVREPLAEWLLERWTPDAPRSFRFDVRGRTLDRLEVSRAARP